METLENLTDRQLRFMHMESRRKLSITYKGRGRPNKESEPIMKMICLIERELLRRRCNTIGRPIEDMAEFYPSNRVEDAQETTDRGE
jgi:hypothetical protein